jgi:hypothetical protein
LKKDNQKQAILSIASALLGSAILNAATSEMVLSLKHVVHSWKQYVSSLELLYALSLLVSEPVCRHVLGATAKNGCMFCMVACVPPKYILDIRLKIIFSARHLGGTGGHFGMLCASRPFAPFFRAAPKPCCVVFLL